MSAAEMKGSDRQQSMARNRRMEDWSVKAEKEIKGK
jgi:hypothetical protein